MQPPHPMASHPIAPMVRLSTPHLPPMLPMAAFPPSLRPHPYPSPPPPHLRLHSVIAFPAPIATRPSRVILIARGTWRSTSLGLVDRIVVRIAGEIIHVRIASSVIWTTDATRAPVMREHPYHFFGMWGGRGPWICYFDEEKTENNRLTRVRAEDFGLLTIASAPFRPPPAPPSAIPPIAFRFRDPVNLFTYQLRSPKGKANNRITHVFLTSVPTTGEVLNIDSDVGFEGSSRAYVIASEPRFGLSVWSNITAGKVKDGEGAGRSAILVSRTASNEGSRRGYVRKVFGHGRLCV